MVYYTMLRTFFKSDLPQLLAIEQALSVTPWSEDTFKMCLQAGYLGWVVEMDKKVVGFIVVSMREEECHILNICVAKEYQHQGLGGKLLDHAVAHARRQGVAIAYLEVRRTNSRAISLYRRRLFQEVGERKGYYPTVGGKEDALIFAKSLIE